MSKLVSRDDFLSDTPAYLFLEDAFASRAEECKGILGPGIGLCYSIKANPFLLRVLPDVFDRVEVCSPGELRICEKEKIDMGRVLFSGINKDREQVLRAIGDGVRLISAESRCQYELICSCFDEYRKNSSQAAWDLSVFLRLTAGSQFGMDEEEIISILKDETHPGINIVGIHFFSGTMKKKAKKIKKELAYLEEFMDRLYQEAGFVASELEYGCGLAAEYFPASADFAQEAEMERLSEIADDLKGLSKKTRLCIEMGRFFAAPAGKYFTKVVETKKNIGISYAIVDGGLHQIKYDGQIQGMQLPVINRIHEGETVDFSSFAGVDSPQDDEKWCICGSLCTTADVLAREARLGSLKEGDTLIFSRVGAYSVYEGMSLFLSRDLPSVYLLTRDGELKCLRERVEAYTLNC